MKTKRAYTQFQSILKKVMKSCGIATREEALEFLDRFWQKTSPDANGISRWVIENIDGQIMQNQCMHIFVPSKEFCDWVVSCVGVLSVNHCEAFAEHFGGHQVYVLNFPTETRLHSFGIGVLLKTTHGAKIFITPSQGWVQSNGGKVETWAVDINGQSSLELDDYIKEAATNVIMPGYFAHSDVPGWVCKLIIGIGMYCSCFPEAVKDGPPEDLKHPSHHQYESVKTIGISHQITLSGTHDSPVAHFRRGHFRVLRSDKFKHKRFQAVFVRETFVNGKAKTVLAPEEVTA